MPVKIHNKSYALVSERVTAFHADNPEGSIRTEIVQVSAERVLMKATVLPHPTEKPECYFTGHAFEERNSSHINKTSYVENCETSAIGRALAALNYGIEDAYASANEVAHAQVQQNGAKPVSAPTQKNGSAPKQNPKLITEKQSKLFYARYKSKGITDEQAKEKIISMGYESSKEITKDDFNGLLEWIDAWQADGAEAGANVPF